MIAKIGRRFRKTPALAAPIKETPKFQDRKAIIEARKPTYSKIPAEVKEKTGSSSITKYSIKLKGANSKMPRNDDA